MSKVEDFLEESAQRASLVLFALYMQNAKMSAVVEAKLPISSAPVQKLAVTTNRKQTITPVISLISGAIAGAIEATTTVSI